MASIRCAGCDRATVGPGLATRQPATAPEAEGARARAPAKPAAFQLTQEDAILAGAMAILGVLLTLAGALWV